MENLRFGNKVAELRKAHELSQYQLGTLVGVTFQAVSKWETKGVVPRRSVCDRLSGVLGFDFGPIIDDNLTPDEAEQLVSRQKEALWEKAENRMKELFGDDPPLPVRNRFIMERNALHRGRSAIMFDILARVRAAAVRKQARFDASGCECFVSWLLGATDVNPMEPHLWCPKCKRVEFHPEAQSGWDLKEKDCECGGRMVPDGQDIPVETCFLGDGELYEHFRCAVDTDFMKEAEEAIINYGEQFFGMKRYHEDGEDGFETDPETGFPVTDAETGEKIPYHSLPISVLMFYPKKKVKNRKPEKLAAAMAPCNWGMDLPCPAVTLMGGFIEPPYLLKPTPFRKDPAELVRQDVMARALKDYWSYHSAVLEERTDLKFPDITPYLGKLTFGKFVTLICSVNNLYLNSGPEELAGAVGVHDLTELPLSMEDLWKLISRSTAYPGYMSGAAGEILQKVGSGQYLSGRDYLPGIKARDRKLFREMNLPDWFETYASNIMSLCYRTPYIDLAILLLDDARRRIRDRK